MKKTNKKSLEKLDSWVNKGPEWTDSDSEKWRFIRDSYRQLMIKWNEYGVKVQPELIKVDFINKKRL